MWLHFIIISYSEKRDPWQNNNNLLVIIMTVESFIFPPWIVESSVWWWRRGKNKTTDQKFIACLKSSDSLLMIAANYGSFFTFFSVIIVDCFWIFWNALNKWKKQKWLWRIHHQSMMMMKSIQFLPKRIRFLEIIFKHKRTQVN